MATTTNPTIVGNNCNNNKSKHMGNHKNDDNNNKPNLRIFKNYLEIFQSFHYCAPSESMPNTNQTSKSYT